MPKIFKPIITASIILAFGQFALVLYLTLQMEAGGASGIPLGISLVMIAPIIGVGFTLALLVELIHGFGKAKSPWKEELPYLIYASGTHLLLLYEIRTDKHKSLAARLILKYPRSHILESNISESSLAPEVVEFAFIGREGEAVCFEGHEQIEGVWERCEIEGENSGKIESKTISKIISRLGEKNESKKSSEMISQGWLFPPFGASLSLASLWRLYQVYLQIHRPLRSHAISESSLDSEISVLGSESSPDIPPTYTLLNYAPSSMLWRFEKLLPPLDEKMTHALKQLQRKDKVRYARRVGGLLSLPFVAIMLYEAWRFVPFVNNTALANYASVNNSTMVGFLLNHGADPHIKRSANVIDYSLAWLFTPESQWSEKREWLERSGFEYAIYHHNNEMFELLLRPEAATYKHIELAIREGNFYAMTRLFDYIPNPSELLLLGKENGCDVPLKMAVSLYASAYEGKIYDNIFALNAISQHRLFFSDREAIVMFLLKHTDIKAYATQCAEGGLYVILQSSGVGEDMLKAFLHAGLSPQKRDIEYGGVSPSLLELFAKSGYRFNERDLFLLLWGDQVWEDKLRALEIALQNGANPNKPYMTRALSGYYEDTDAQAVSEIATYPLHRAFSVAILELLYKYGMRNINQPYITPDGTAHTQLQRILTDKEPNLRAILWLLKHGAKHDKSDIAKLYALLESHEKSLEDKKEDLAEEVWERQSKAFKELKGEILKIIAK